MATTSEQLAQAVSAINALNQTYAQEVGKWQGERNSMMTLLSQAIAAVPNMRKQFFIDSVNGNDANDGTSSKPFATIEKALALATTIWSGQVEIICRPGVYDVTTTRNYSNINLYIGGAVAANTNDVIINWRSNAHDLTNCIFRSRFCTINRTYVETAEHQKAVVKLTGGAAVIGAYAPGTISATNRSLHFISDGCPLVATEAAGAFVSLEATYAENTSASPKNLVQTRNMLLLYKTINSILSNFITPATAITYASVTL